MIVVLLISAVFAIVVPIRLVHALLLIVHIAYLANLARSLLRRQPLSTVFIGAYILMYFFNPLLIAIGVIPLEYSSSWSTYFLANGLMMAGIDLFVMGAIWMRTTPYDLDRVPLMKLRSGPVEMTILGILAAVSIAIITLVLVMQASGVDVFVVHKTFRSTGQGGIWFLQVTYSAMALPLAVFLIALKPKGQQIHYLITVAAILLFHFTIFRIRTLPISVCIAYIVAMFARTYAVSLAGQPVWGSVTRNVRLAIIVGAPILLIAGVATKYLRASYQMDDYEITRERVDRLIEHTFAGGDLGHSFFVRLAIENYPERNKYLMGQSYYRLLFVPIPRAIWPGKPESTSRIFARVVDPALGRRGTTIPPGIVGDLYINFGHFGVIGMFVIGAIFAQERYKGLPHLLALAAMGYWLFKFTRGNFSTLIITAVVIWIFSLLVSRFIRPIYLEEEEQDDGEAYDESLAA